jgi:glutathione synthase
MTIKLGVVMDPIAEIKVKKDSTLAMLLAAQKRGWELHYMELDDLELRDGRAIGKWRRLEVRDDPAGWFYLSDPAQGPLGALDVILMRKDPPFDTEYIFATYILEQAERDGALVVNKPRGLRDANEKLFTSWFPQCCPPTLVTRDAVELRRFLTEIGEIVLKPLDGMGGASVFRVGTADPNVSVIIETLTDHGRRFTMAQQFLPAIADGDKRILLVDGEPVPYALARIPAVGETRGNLAAGGTGVGRALTDRDRWICEQVGTALRERGLVFVGLDVIGDFLTEINVTSPTCIRELDAIFGLDIGDVLMAAIETRYLPGRRVPG